MKKALPLLVVLCFLVLVLPSVLAIDVKIEKISSEEVMIAEIGNPVTFELNIKNNGATDTFKLFNLLGFIMSPSEPFLIEKGQTRKIELKIFPRESLDVRDFFVFTYFIKASDNTEQEEQLLMKIINLEDAFEVGTGEVDPESSSINVFIKNTVNFDFPEVDARFTSNFFSTTEQNFSLKPLERKDFLVQLNKDDFRKLSAGFYTLKSEIEVDELKANVEGIIKFAEKNITTTSKREYGLVISTKIIEKVNEGNTIVKSETVLKKNIVSRLFTSFSPEPDIVNREGGTIYYTWNNNIKPGETLKIEVKTNWLFPLIVILFIVIIVVLAKQYSKTNLVLKKKVSFVKTKGGEFALKVSVFVNAKNYIEKVKIIDRLPGLVKVYERFSSETPTRVDEKNKRIEWEYEKLEAGEIRILSYIIYSKVGVLGKFALPSTRATYEHNGKFQESESNKAFFIAEQRKGEVEDE